MSPAPRTHGRLLQVRIFDMRSWKIQSRRRHVSASGQKETHIGTASGANIVMSHADSLVRASHSAHRPGSFGTVWPCTARYRKHEGCQQRGPGVTESGQEGPDAVSSDVSQRSAGVGTDDLKASSCALQVLVTPTASWTTTTWGLTVSLETQPWFCMTCPVVHAAHCFQHPTPGTC